MSRIEDESIRRDAELLKLIQKLTKIVSLIEKRLNEH